MITIVLADDHKILRQGLKALLAGEEDFSVIGEAEDGIRAVELVEQLHPDVLVVDLMMGGMNGLEASRAVRRRSPKTRVVFLSMYGNEAYVDAAFESGALGYVLKEASSTELGRAIREACAGRCYLSPPLSAEALERYRKNVRQCLMPEPDPPRARPS